MNDRHPPLIDTHAHLDNGRFTGDLDEVLQRAGENGISHILTIGCDLESSRQSVALAGRYGQVYAAVGIHPHEAREVSENTVEELRKLIENNDKVVAIGETGLDFYRDHCPRDIQRTAFRRQIALAKEVGLPLIVHDREAHDEILTILREEQADQVGGVLHCFSGDLAMARACIDLGFFVSFPGTLTYPGNEALREVARAISTDHLLVETDCPYLSPQPMRGRRNEPAFLRHTAEELARIKGLTPEDIARITTFNSHRLFGIGDLDQSRNIAYKIRNSLYLNITNRCSNTCGFCAKFDDFSVKGHRLQLDHEPDAEEVKKAVGDPRPFDEVVFCGYGEPLLRLDLVKEVAAWLKQQGVKVRINTDGQANLVYGRNILPELAGLIDAVSVSLNAPDAETYQQLCHSRFGGKGYQAVKDFLREAVNCIPSVTASAVTLPGIDMEACRKVAEDELRVRFLRRQYNETG
jgi:TatD DNase family protein